MGFAMEREPLDIPGRKPGLQAKHNPSFRAVYSFFEPRRFIAEGRGEEEAGPQSAHFRRLQTAPVPDQSLPARAAP